MSRSTVRQPRCRCFSSLSRAPEKGQGDVAGILKEPGQAGETAGIGVIGQYRLDPGLSVQAAEDRLAADRLRGGADDGGGLVDEVPVSSHGHPVAAEFKGDRGDAGLAPPAGQRPAGRDPFPEPRVQLDAHLSVGVGPARRERGPPVPVGGDDVGGEIVDEPHRPDEQRAEDFLGDPAGGVLAGAGIRRAPAVEVQRVEAQPAGRQAAAPEPELAYSRAGSFPGARVRQGRTQEPLVVLKVSAGHPAHARIPAGCPLQEPGVVGEGRADGSDRGMVLAGRDGPGEHGVAQFLADLPVGGGDRAEVEDEAPFVFLEHRGAQVPDVIAEPGGGLQGPARAKRPAREDERVASRRGRGPGTCGMRCGDGHGSSQGFSIRSRRASPGLRACACSSSAGVNLARMSSRMATQAGP